MRVYTRLLVAAVLACFTAAPGCHRTEPQQSAASSEVTVATAANLTTAVAALGKEFEEQTGIHPVFSFASTAELTAQIEQSAPFDVFLAADSEHAEKLDREGFLTPGTRAVYAIGVLALWVPASSGAHIDSLAGLTQPGIKVIAVAKPELAPYGQAAVEALQHAGIWERVQPKIVYAENISVAKQYGAAGNADAVFTAYSLVLNESGQVIQVDGSLHRPITQEASVIAKSAHPAEARKFLDFILKGAGRETLKHYGYRIPPL
jgi:molybdate transport system substrate-binding protein